MLALIAAFSFGAIVHLAAAAHWHSAGPPSGSCSAGNGLVHGASTTDGAFRARVDQDTCPPTFHDCETLDSRNFNSLAYSSAYYGTCDAFYNAGVPEQYGAAAVQYQTTFSLHIHYAH
jgi:hypothetical protein